MKYEVHPAADLFPLLEGDEFTALVEDIKQQGLLEPIWLYEGKLLDGRNRARACAELGVEPETREYTGDDPVQFVLSENVRRRHLNATQLAGVALRSDELRGRLEAEAKQRMSEGGQGKVAHQYATFGKTTTQLGKSVGVSQSTVEQRKRVEEKAPDLVPQLDDGTLSAKRADRIVREREAEARRVQEAKEAAKLKKVRTRVGVRLGDFREVLDLDAGSVNAIITDPPYPKEFIPLLSDLATWADHVLTDDGVLAVMMGQSYLPEVYERLSGGRPYRWTMAFVGKDGYVAHQPRMSSLWKPIILYGGHNGIKNVRDIVTPDASDAASKDHHHWGQDLGAFKVLVERLTKPGHVVADPFMGAGTTLVAAQMLGRHAIGADIDEDSFETTKKRLGI